MCQIESIVFILKKHKQLNKNKETSFLIFQEKDLFLLQSYLQIQPVEIE
jgi:hypothetical protein